MRAWSTTSIIKKDPGRASTRVGVTKSLRYYNNVLPIELIDSVQA
jgi:hypothetical protein